MPNTLAVFAVHTYLQWIQIETDLENSDSWNLGANSLFDVCDLELPNIGKIICCPVLPDVDNFTSPDFISPDAIAYLPVRFGEVLNEVELLGYRPIIDNNNAPEKIYLDPCDAESLADNYDDGGIFPIENLLTWLFKVEDIRTLLENEGDDFNVVVGMQKLLAQQFISYSQIAVKSIHYLQNGISGKELVTAGLNNTGNSLKSTLNNLKSTDDNISEEEAETELAEIGNQWLEIVRKIIDDTHF
ncbi:MAG: DUF1822 family protein [Nostocales cyanobacterium]|nr:MAG: DUF1822 family protein [Nostocales cyanobacterium]TAF12417.1 MAG: DUF1822 family protein [Nostocales cyanobacterium]